ncbi:hypothetical protein [Dactylosporangium salmoneum]|uniref:hypothetical protein n=1 Tax=Dactylosporangium salmoneum TaxID=53361 RepID=UPI0031E3D311
MADLIGWVIRLQRVRQTLAEQVVSAVVLNAPVRRILALVVPVAAMLAGVAACKRPEAPAGPVEGGGRPRRTADRGPSATGRPGRRTAAAEHIAAQPVSAAGPVQLVEDRDRAGTTR